MKRRHVVTSIVATGLIAATSLATSNAGAGTAHHAAKAPKVVSSNMSPTQQANSLKYWTKARMRSAKNLDTITIKGSPKTSTAALAKAHGTPHAIAGKAPSGATSTPKASPRGANPAFAYPFPYTRFTVTPYKLTKKYPRMVNGKVFFTQNGGNYVCSGTSVISPLGNRVWTAGHCISNGAGIFDSSIVFVPAYNGNAGTVNPRGTWTGYNLTTTSSWHNSGDFSQDLGSFDTAAISGHTLSSKVGSAGFAYGQSADQQWVDFGYPQASPFNGTVMTVCLAASAVRDTGIGGAGPQPIGIGCDMTGGSSGGSWQFSWSEGAPGYINGHNDYKYGAQPLAMYSPYFDSLANAVRCYGQGTGTAGC